MRYFRDVIAELPVEEQFAIRKEADEIIFAVKSSDTRGIKMAKFEDYLTEEEQ